MLTLSPRRATAQNFAPIRCANNSEFDGGTYGASGAILDFTRTDVEGSINTYPVKTVTLGQRQLRVYKTRVKYERTFIANEFTSRIDLKWRYFLQPEGGADEIKWYAEGAGVFPNVWTGRRFAENSWSPTILGNPSLQDRPATLSITSKDRWRGVVAAQSARVSCNAAGGAPDLAIPKYQLPYTGLLHGQNDTIYVKIPNDRGDPGNPYHHYHTSIALWGFDNDTQASPHDYDLYVRCGQRPTSTVGGWDHSFNGFPEAPEAFSPNPQRRNDEFAELDNWECDADYWHVAIHSYRGRGAFNIVWNVHNSTDHQVLRVGVEYPQQYFGDAADVTAMKLLKRSMRRLWGATEGSAKLITETHVYSVPSCSTYLWPAFIGWNNACGGHDCDICLKGGKYGSDPSDLANKWCDIFGNCRIVAYRLDLRDGKVPVHELGHLYWGLPDEYVGTKRQCGHSLMATANTGVNTSDNFCSAYNHPTSADIASDDDPNWPDIKAANSSIVVWRNDMSFDAHSYNVFNFRDVFAQFFDHRP